jgi:hypothetical protein
MPVFLHCVDAFGVASHVPMTDTEAAAGEYRHRADDVKPTRTDVDLGSVRSTIEYSRHCRRIGGTDEKLIVSEFVSLDGVMQAPGGKDEDRDGGFEHGGWTVPYWHRVGRRAEGAAGREHRH